MSEITYPTCHWDKCTKKLVNFDEFELLTDQSPSGALYFCTALHAKIWSITESGDADV